MTFQLEKKPNYDINLLLFFLGHKKACIIADRLDFIACMYI